MQTALHQYSGASEFDGLADLFVDGIELEDVALFRCRPFQGTVEGAEGAVLGTKIRVVNIAVDDVGDRTFGMKPAPDRVGFHSDADQVIGLEHLQGLLFRERHRYSFILAERTSGIKAGTFQPRRSAGATSRRSLTNARLYRGTEATVGGLGHRILR